MVRIAEKGVFLSLKNSFIAPQNIKIQKIK
jgi:hypothetical protein